MTPGYCGKLGWVDLSLGRTWEEPLDESLARKFIGGKGLGAELLYRHVQEGTDPFDAKNLLIFMTGPLTGTGFPATSRSAVITKSPLTGTFLDSYSGGFFGPHLKFCGYDALLIRGRCPDLSYVLVSQGKISVRSAEHLRGLETSEAEARLKRELGPDERVSVASIGPAGEKGVLFSSIINDRRAYGRGGTGAVMGAKNLKAVVLVGGEKFALADKAKFSEAAGRARDKIAVHPMLKKGGAFPRVGTMATLDLTQETGTLPTRNWQENSSPHARAVGAEAFDKHVLRPQACWACPIGCSREAKADVQGREFVTEGPEYETMYAFGPNCDVRDPGVIIAADRLCDDYGMDTISCGVAIGFAMECFEKGLIDLEDTGGLDLRFGNAEAVLEAVHRIARREGIGELLGQGVRRASQRIPGSEKLAMHVKGMELPGYDPRGMKGQALTYALSDRGGCHLRSNTLRTELMGLPKPLDRYGYDEKAGMVRDLQLRYATLDSLIACVFGAFAVTLDDYADAVSAATGWSLDANELLLAGERAWNQSRLFNVREGLGRKDDTLPPRLFSEPSTRGPSEGQVVHPESFAQMLDEYYEVAGWDPATGIPTPAKLKALGLAD